MSWGYSRFDLLANILSGSAATAAIVICTTNAATALSSREIAQIATNVTVQINNTLGTPGGSGAIIAQEGNIYTVLTANHVVESQAVEYVVRTPDGREYPVIAVKSLQQSKQDPDLAIVEFQSSQTYKIATIGNSNQAEQGLDIYVSGFPLGIDGGSDRFHEFTTGIITSIQSDRERGYSLRYNALTRRGMSGGPVFDPSGRIIGVHGEGDREGVVRSESANGVTVAELKTGFNAAIPVNTFTSLIARAGINRSQLTFDDRSPDNLEQAKSPERQELVEALNYVDEGKVSEASQAFNRIVERDRNSAIAWLYRGLTRYTRGDRQGAIADYTQAIQVEANFFEAYSKRGLAYYRLGDKQKALADYNQALQLNPSDAYTYLNRGVLREDLGDRQGAFQDYDRAVQVAPKYGLAYHNRGIIRYYQREFEAALEDMQKASELCFEQGDIDCYNTTVENLNQIQRQVRRNSQRQQQIENQQQNTPQPVTPPQNTSQPVTENQPVVPTQPESNPGGLREL
ncbi:MAG: tetratricopeptide repeat-containing serine protease family protein [Oscillatoria sp. PMC 1051.18]|nr:tetratricopeptide repeat-containing serine protease family protein [Oscillatoria sp. PMC 1050.18]MEC5028770.1 tetratricopeptide repeat-containing serine protease family protein [Oscillatoria sp. PMC 1051.18]